MKRETHFVLELRLVEQNEKGKEISHFCCNRAVAFRKFDKRLAEKFVSGVQAIAQRIGELLGFSVYYYKLSGRKKDDKGSEG